MQLKLRPASFPCPHTFSLIHQINLVVLSTSEAFVSPAFLFTSATGGEVLFLYLWMGQDLFQLKPPKPPINASICCDIFWLAWLRSSCNELKLTFLLSFSFFFSSCSPLVNNAASQCVFIFCSLRTANCLAEDRKGQVEDLRRQKRELVSRIMLVFVKPVTAARLIDNLKLAFA